MSESFVRPMANSLLHCQRVPGPEVVEVLLDDDIAAAGILRILVPDDYRSTSSLTFGIFGAVDEPQQVSLVEGSKAVYLVNHVTQASEALRQPLGKLEAQIHAMSPDMKQQVARRRGCTMSNPLEFGKSMQSRWSRLAEQQIPNGSTHADHAGQLTFGKPEADRSP